MFSSFFVLEQARFLRNVRDLKVFIVRKSNTSYWISRNIISERKAEHQTRVMFIFAVTDSTLGILRNSSKADLKGTNLIHLKLGCLTLALTLSPVRVH